MTSRSRIDPHAGSSTSNIWLTPPHIINAFEPFDLDPCAAPAPRPFPTARHHYTEAEGCGLRRPWFDDVWLNPPYGDQIERWLARLAAHGRGIALVFARTGSPWFVSEIWGKAEALLFLHGRVTFLRPDGSKAKHNSGCSSVLVAYGPKNAEQLHGCGLAGEFRPVGLASCLYHIHSMQPQGATGAAAPASSTWRGLLKAIFQETRRPLTLAEIYDLVGDRQPVGAHNGHVRAKIRQTLARGGFARVDHAQYCLDLVPQG